jgi:hypothetical protein
MLLGLEIEMYWVLSVPADTLLSVLDLFTICTSYGILFETTSIQQCPAWEGFTDSLT